MNLDEIAHEHQTLVLEGCDGVGKSTLGALLSTHHGFRVVHSPKTPDHVDLVNRYRNILAGTERILFDRCFISELVYGPLYRGGSRISWSQAIELTESVVARAGLLIHLTAPPAFIHRRLVSRDGEASSLEEISALADSYERVFFALSSYASVLTLDTTTFELPPAG